MRILFALPGFHKYSRGAEVALASIAEQLASRGHAVTLIGSGCRVSPSQCRYLRAPSISRERFERLPTFPPLRSIYAYEELTFVPGLLARYRPLDYDITVTCSFPFTNLVLRRPTLWRGRPKHVFITQNGDWPAHSKDAEYRFFSCDGLVCTNPDYYRRNKARWLCELIPNGVDLERFKPGPSERHEFGIPEDRTVVLMVSALIPSKRVDVAISVMKQMPGAHLVVAGDGPLRREIQDRARRELPGRFTLLSIPANRMPSLYRSANVFLHLSLEESFGNVFLEALASGLPVVGHDSERLRWIVGDQQFLLDTTNEDALATAIERASKTDFSMRDANARRVSAFSWQTIGARYEDFFKRLARAESL